MAGGLALATDEGRGYQYTGRTTAAVIWLAIVAASGGLLFGFDNGITGGVITQPDFLDRFFPEVLDAGAGANAYCKFDDQLLQLFTSCMFLAGAVAAIIGMYTCKRWGRKVTMMMGGFCFLIGTILVASAFHIAQLVIGRIILGFGVGFATMATPLYLAEMAPYRLRGALNIMFQLAVTIGILAAQLINYGTQNITPWGWRLSLALGAIPACLLFFGSLALPDTPTSLIARGKPEEGLAVLQRVRGVTDVNVELEDITAAVNLAATVPNPFKNIIKRRFRPQLVISLLIPIFQQMTGINSIMFYAPQLFATLGSADAALLNTVIIGAVNVGATFVAILVVDRFGRKVLFIEGGIQMVVCEIIVGTLILHGMGKDGTGVISSSMAKAIIAFICIYVAGFAWSWGPLGWLVPSEIQPLATRAAGTAINTCTNFVATFVIGQAFLTMLCSMKFGVFYFFAGWVVLMTLFVIFFVPETRKVPIEEVEEVRIGRHWFWRRIVAGTQEPVMPVTAAKNQDIAMGNKNQDMGMGNQQDIGTSPTDTPVTSNYTSPRSSVGGATQVNKLANPSYLQQ